VAKRGSPAASSSKRYAPRAGGCPGSVEVGADDGDDAVAELVAHRVEVLEVQLLADGLEGLGELRVEEFLERADIAGAFGTDRLRDLDDVLLGLVDADEEGDADVGADVVLADQTVASGAAQLDGLHRDVHHLGLVQHRQHDLPGEGHVDLPQLGDDQRLALLHLAEQPGDDEYGEQANGDEHADTRDHGSHGIRP
jgi:hypothetical protein